jgi:predicted nucleic acid-binding protein
LTASAATARAFVLDASVTATWLFDDEADPVLDALLRALLPGQAAVPALWHLETANLLAQGERRGRITAAQIPERRTLLAALRVETDTTAPERGLGPILDLARRHRLSAYDAAYLDLALRCALPLASKDAALRRVAQAEGVALLPAEG